MTTNLETPSAKNDRDIFWIAAAATALALGTVFASNESVSRDANGFAFHISVGTFIAFAIGAVVGWAYWKIVARNSDKPSAALRAASILLLIVGLGAFLYPLRFLPTNQLSDVAKGLGVDVIVLSILGVILWKIGAFFNNDGNDSAPTGKNPPPRK